ncbi:YheC/YheD family endospore coat-associated protein [Paenibacillus sedimenti]|uniref:YheC/YheD family protein n=1 Tax=Paenibacillus sedimenti TaxID=2770274 RepID=A0A926KQR4_9BACL|nr:YheC/YheD family protein [Paenibacillus sedimenti]MBD0382215.1 YheC/YheD family protein [Paenibacillus sedimenti]
MKIGTTVGIMVPRKRQRKAVLRTYNKYNNLDISLACFIPEDINWKKKKILALCMDKGVIKERVISFPQAVYNCCYLNQRKTIERMERIIGKNKTFNYLNRLNKWEVYRILESTHLRRFLPHTCIYKREQLQKTFDKHKLVYLKPCLGHHGNGVFRLELLNENLRISEDSLPPRYIWRLDDKQLAGKVERLLKGKQYIVQSGISMTLFNDKYFDLRALVQKNEQGDWDITSIVSRLAYKQYYNTSVYEEVHITEVIMHSLFPPDESIKIMKTIQDVSIQAAAELEKGIGLMAEVSVDYGLDINGALWIIEMNGKPQKKIYNDVAGIGDRSAMYRRPLEYASYLAAQSTTSI